MPHRGDHTICACAQLQALHRVRPVGGDVKHLLARQRGFDRTLELAGGQRGQNHIAINGQLSAKPTADVAANDAHLRRGNLQRVGHALVRTFQQLGRAMDVYALALPIRQRAVRLHLRVNVHGRGVARVNLHGGSGKGLVEVTHVGIGVPITRLDGLGHTGLQLKRAFFLGVDDANQLRGCTGLLKLLRHHKRDGLAIVANLVIAQLRPGAGKTVFDLFAAVRRLGRCIFVRHHQQHAGGLFSRCGVNAGDAAFGDMRFQHKAVSRAGAFLAFHHFVGVRGLAGDF